MANLPAIRGKRGAVRETRLSGCDGRLFSPAYREGKDPWCCPMEVAWKCTLQRSAEGLLPVLCAVAGSQTHRTPAISKMSGRFTNMSLPFDQSVRRFHKLCGPTRDGRTGRPGPARGRTRESSSGAGTPAD